jgi:hypothetical protein
MKKLLCVVCLILSLTFVFTSCGDSTPETPNTNDTTINSGDDQTGGDQTGGDQTGGNQTDGDQTGGNQNGGDQNGGDQNGGDQNGGNQDSVEADIKMEDIVFSSAYSEGLAVINLRAEENTAYVINKNGKIVFNFPLKEGYSSYTIRNMKFQNGLLVYEGKCYSKDGTVTLPETVGATAFVEYDGTHIIAEKITSDYASATKELGVLNSDFQWVVSPSEGCYELYYSNSTIACDFFWNDIVNSDGSKKVFMYADYSNNSNIYFSDGTMLTPEGLNVTDIIAIYENKYILAKPSDNSIGVMDPDGEWILEPTADFWDIYRNSEVEVKGDVLSTKNGDTLLYYDLKTKATTAFEKEQLLLDYAENAAVSKIICEYDGENIIYKELVFGAVSENDIFNFDITASDNDKYILVTVCQNVLLTGTYEGQTYEQEESADFYAVLDADSNWILKGIRGEAEIKGDYLCVSNDDETLYYDLRTGDVFMETPSDLPSDDYEEDTPEVDSEFDFHSIPNFYKMTDFVNGKAAVALWNADVREMYLVIVNTDGEFLFTPKKIPAQPTGIGLFPLYFDGTYVVTADNTGCGTGYIQNILNIYTYDLNGEQIAHWKASDDISTFNCSFEYNDGVLVFNLFNGQYSDYNRQSSVLYYTHEFKTLFQ